jgi:putative aldouronate transport system permease protein
MMMGAKAANRTFDTVNIVLLSVCVVLCVAPLLHIIAISFSSNRPILAGEVTLFPVELNFQAYARVLGDTTMLKSLGFTVLLTVLYTVICMLMTIAAAYPLTKSELKGKKFVMVMIVITMFFSGGIIPEYILVKQLHLLDTIWSMILPGMISPFYMIILISFFQSIPKSLEESAELDGSSYFRTLTQIIIPLSMPVLATLSLFYAVGRWNGFMDSLFYITDPNLYPLQLKLYQLIMNSMATDLLQMEGNHVVQIVPESLKAANIMFATVPILIVYPWLQKHFVSGIMVGSVKG